MTRVFSEEHREKLRQAKLGKPGYWKGKKRPEIKTWLSEFQFEKGYEPWCKGKKCPQLSGENQSSYKGENVSYRNLHRWVERNLGKPKICENCKDNSLRHRQYHWANKSRNYKRNLTDWVRLCVKCHKAYDRNQLALS